MKDNRAFAAGRIRHTFRSKEIAEKLWPAKAGDDGPTWELMYAIDSVRDLSIKAPTSTSRSDTNRRTTSRALRFSSRTRATTFLSSSRPSSSRWMPNL